MHVLLATQTAHSELAHGWSRPPADGCAPPPACHERQEPLKWPGLRRCQLLQTGPCLMGQEESKSHGTVRLLWEAACQARVWCHACSTWGACETSGFVAACRWGPCYRPGGEPEACDLFQGGIYLVQLDIQNIFHTPRWGQRPPFGFERTAAPYPTVILRRSWWGECCHLAKSGVGQPPDHEMMRGLWL